MANPILTLTDAPAPEVWTGILEPLVAFSNARAGRANDGRLLVIALSDPDDGHIVGGLWGGTNFGHLRIDLFFVPEASRGRGVGRRVLSAAETEARARGCHAVWVDTFAFQAPGFYERMGYAVFGTIADNPVGHDRFFLKKSLVPFAGSPQPQ